MLVERGVGFDHLLSDSIVSVLDETFGCTGMGVLYSQLKLGYNVDFLRMPLDIHAFEVSVLDLLGSGGEVVLRNVVLLVSERLGAERRDWGQGFRENVLYLSNLFVKSLVG